MHCSYTVQRVHSKGALLMILLSLTVYSYWSIVPGGNIFTELKETQYIYSAVPVYLTLILQIFFPVFGWIADAWIGRFKTILYGLCLLILGCIFFEGSAITIDFEPTLSIIFQWTSTVFNSLGIAAIYANMLPFITDQMIGASADELTAIVHWWFWSQTFANMIAHTIPCVLQDTPQMLTSIFLSFSGLTIALSSIFLCQHWLDKTPQITNPIKHIAKVLNYARKNKYPRNRSALTYWEQDIPSRLDLGKDKYGGPFSEEEVENVKTTLRLIPVIFICAMVELAMHVRSSQRNHMTINDNSILGCLLWDQSKIFPEIATVGIPLYHFIIRPLLHKITKYTPSMLKLLGVAFFLKNLEVIGMIAIETIGHLQTPNVTCMFNTNIEVVMSLNYYWTIIPLVLKTVGDLIFLLVVNEFILAQSPLQMKGFLFGLYYAFESITTLIGYNLHYPFKLLPQSIPISCGFYYYLTQTLILSLVFIIFLILSKYYKLRVRDNPINLHMIAELHITAYINQEKEHSLNRGQENDSNTSSSDSEDTYTD